MYCKIFLQRKHMSKILVLTEKPSVAKDIARVLGCRKSGNGCLIGDKYVITWALGHLVTLADPEAYDDKYKTWRMRASQLPRVFRACYSHGRGARGRACCALDYSESAFQKADEAPVDFIADGQSDKRGLREFKTLVAV